ncbi:hypothetical protein HPB52_015527 [Rhipicephalus sanguineus]|uniref:F5/8 type C domain-containing protein n=1 Tax=Rhipicephalus sanguineus TaxID=34632 RepID=A0A9D4SNR2_RHISA|nr:hypothetical protein HPB52_015527 [Rhipicephalus sanguineus]
MRTVPATTAILLATLGITVTGPRRWGATASSSPSIPLVHHHQSHATPDDHCRQPGPLGLLAGRLQEWQLSASSTRQPECQLRYARVLELASRGAWCPAKDADTEWIQVDLGADAKITGLLTQGRGDGREWVSSFAVSYSMDAYHWKHCLDLSYLDPPVHARFLRLHVLRWHGRPSLRFEPLGCQGTFYVGTVRRSIPHVTAKCNEVISVPPVARLTASSWRPWHPQQGSCSPDEGQLFARGGGPGAGDPSDRCGHQGPRGCPAQALDHGVPALLLQRQPPMAALQGRQPPGSQGRSAFSSATLAAARRAQPLQVFGGNMDRDTERRHYLNQPFVARFVRFQPTSWKRRIALRAAVIGKLYHEMSNLDKLTAYVVDRPRLEEIPNAYKCASVSRLHGALSRRRLHFECPDDMEGRYVYLKASGVHNRKGRLYAAVLCEVMVY